MLFRFLMGTLGTAASIASLGKMAFSAGSWIGTNVLHLLALKTGGRVRKAGGGALIDTQAPRYHKMEVSFDNLMQRYGDPLLAAAAMDVGTKIVDTAIAKAKKTGREPADFLPRRAQEYMYALSQAAIGAHQTASRQRRAAGGRMGYADTGRVNP